MGTIVQFLLFSVQIVIAILEYIQMSTAKP